MVRNLTGATEHMVSTGAFAGKFQKRVELLQEEISHISSFQRTPTALE